MLNLKYCGIMIVNLVHFGILIFDYFNILMNAAQYLHKPVALY
jgi:hypothetical protein